MALSGFDRKGHFTEPEFTLEEVCRILEIKKPFLIKLLKAIDIKKETISFVEMVQISSFLQNEKDKYVVEIIEYIPSKLNYTPLEELKDWNR